MQDDKIKNLNSIYMHVGYALFSAQLMEKELAFLLLVPEIKKKKNLPSDEEIKKVTDNLDRMTFGCLTTKLRDNAKMSESSDELLKKALKERNFLAHHFFSEYSGKLNDTETQKIMIKRLISMREIFTEIYDGLAVENIRIMKLFGINLKST